MPRDIYNEGRVVGLSAYEIYLRQFVVSGQKGEPATEREWLSASLGMGASLLIRLLRINDTKVAGYNGPKYTHIANSEYYIDIPLPNQSRLRAANTIFASYFNGEAEWLSEVESSTQPGKYIHYENRWFASKVTRFGQIDNESGRSPSISSTVSVDDNSNKFQPQPLDSETISDEAVSTYINIIDGSIIQPGSWSVVHANSKPHRIVVPDLTQRPVIRIRIRIPNPENMVETKILLTGLTNNAALMGQVNLEPEVSDDLITDLITRSPHDGDFLGPQAWPWAVNIVFNLPNGAAPLISEGVIYERKLPEDDDPKRVKNNHVLDFESGHYPDQHNCYEPGTQPAKLIGRAITGGVSLKATKIVGRYPDVHAIAAYNPSGDSWLPPALYYEHVDRTNYSFLMHPLDSVALGSTKIFKASQFILDGNYPGKDPLKSAKMFANKYAQNERQVSALYLDDTDAGQYTLYYACYNAAHTGSMPSVPVAKVESDSSDNPDPAVTTNPYVRVTVGNAKQTIPVARVLSVATQEYEPDNVYVRVTAGSSNLDIPVAGISQLTDSKVNNLPDSNTRYVKFTAGNDVVDMPVVKFTQDDEGNDQISVGGVSHTLHDVETLTVNIGEGSLTLQVQNFGWLGADSSGVLGTVIDSSKAHTVLLYRRIYGIIPEYVKDLYGFDYTSTWVDGNRINRHVGWWSRAIIKCLEDMYGFEKVKQDYYFIAMSTKGTLSDGVGDQGYSFYPVRKSDNVLDVVYPCYRHMTELPDSKNKDLKVPVGDKTKLTSYGFPVCNLNVLDADKLDGTKYITDNYTPLIQTVNRKKVNPSDYFGCRSTESGFAWALDTKNNDTVYDEQSVECSVVDRSAKLWKVTHPRMRELSPHTLFRFHTALAPKLIDYNDSTITKIEHIMLTQKQTRLSDIFTSSQLNALGIFNGYRNLSLWEFVNQAINHSVTTGERIAPTIYGLSGSLYLIPNGEYKTDKLGREISSTADNSAIASFLEHGFESDATLNVSQLDNSVRLDMPISSDTLFATTSVKLPENDGYIQSNNMYVSQVTCDGVTTRAISLSDGRVDLELGGSSGEISLGGTELLTWSHLLLALGNNKKLDVLGPALQAFRQSALKQVANNRVDLNYDISVPRYVEVNGIRLYISSEPPTGDDIPVGSIGIGWTESEA